MHLGVLHTRVAPRTAHKETNKKKMVTKADCGSEFVISLREMKCKLPMTVRGTAYSMGSRFVQGVVFDFMTAYKLGGVTAPVHFVYGRDGDHNVQEATC